MCIRDSSHVVHYCTSVFEGIRAYDNKKGTCIFRLNEHVKLLFNSKILSLKSLPKKGIDPG